MARKDPDPGAGWQADFTGEESEARRLLPGQLVRWSIAFGLLFALVFFLFWWSGSAIHFGAARVAERPVPAWRVTGTVKNAVTGEPIPWAAVRDAPDGRPPFFQATADPGGKFELLTLAERHYVLVEAAGYRSGTAAVGRPWFIWWPRGEETKEFRLIPE